jgi:hypothetical protein
MFSKGKKFVFQQQRSVERKKIFFSKSSRRLTVQLRPNDGQKIWTPQWRNILYYYIAHDNGIRRDDCVQSLTVPRTRNKTCDTTRQNGVQACKWVTSLTYFVCNKIRRSLCPIADRNRSCRTLRLNKSYPSSCFHAFQWDCGLRTPWYINGLAVRIRLKTKKKKKT